MILPTDSQWARYSVLCARLRPLPLAERKAEMQALQGVGTDDPQVLSLVALHFALPPDPGRVRTGERVANCTLEEILGAGGMGVVYRAQQHIGQTTRPVAVKFIHPTLLRTAREEALARFQAEMGTLVKLEHESIARIYDGGIYVAPHTHEQLPYLAIELVRGGLPLTSYSQAHALLVPERLTLFLRVCRAVQYAHEHRVVHRDLKPANILVDSEGRPFIIDFGLAQACDALLPGAHLAASGTPAYMSPEQVSESFDPISDKSDVYALGLILYELLTGQLPYTLPCAGTVAQWRQVITEAPLPPLRQDDAGDGGELETIVAAALAKRPAERIRVDVLRSRLERYLQQLPPWGAWPQHDLRQAPQGKTGTDDAFHVSGSGPPEPERRQLTVLVCRLGGVAAPLDPEELLEVMPDYHAIGAEVVHRFDGHMAPSQGTELVGYFGYPRAHEDDARRAVHTGLGLVAGMAELNRRCPRDHGGQWAVQVGIHTGMVVVSVLGHRDACEPLTLGDTPMIAARVQTLAAPDTVVISSATWRLTAGYFVTQALGTHGLEAAAEPLAVYQVLQAIPAQRRMPSGLTPFVGREHERGLLRDRWQQALEGQGQVVEVSGEVGIGKSRLVQMFQESVAGAAYARVEYYCSPYYQQSAFYPIIEQMQRQLQVRPDETPAARLRPLEDMLRPYRFALEEVVPLLAALLSIPLSAPYVPVSLPPERQKQQTLAVLLTWMLHEAARLPVCVVVEDLHWGDPSTLEWLTFLLDQIPTARVLLLLLFRPEFQPPWAGRSHLTRLTLGRLSRRQTETMIEQVGGGKRLPIEVMQQVVANTDGVPLFVEELTKMVLESELVKEREGHYALVDPLPPLAIPATLHGSLMARLDQVGPAKQVAQLGATLGREFSYELIRLVSPVEEATLQHGLTQLVAAEVLYQQWPPPQAQYRFKHALIQEAAYQSLLRSTQQQYHQQIVRVLEAQFPETREIHPELLAQHALRGKVWEKAVLYWWQAGEKACARAANREAVTCLEQALQALQHLPASRDTCAQAIDLRLALRNALLPLGAYERIAEHLREATTLAQTLDDPQRQGWAVWGMADYFRWAGENDRALAAGERALALAATSGDLSLQVAANGLLSQVAFFMGHYGRAVDTLRRNMAVYDGAGRQTHFGMAGPFAVHERAWLARSLAELGAFTEGSASGEEAVRRAETLENPHSLSAVYQGLGFLYFRQGDLPKAIALLERGLGICRSAHMTSWLPETAAPLSAAYALAGRLDDAVPLLRHALEQSVARDLKAARWRLIAQLSEAYPLAHHLEEMRALVQVAVERSRVHHEPGCHAWALRMLGELYAYQDPPQVKQAEACYQEARGLAAALGMRPLLAHCHLGLGAVYAQRGRREQGRAEVSTALDLYHTMGMVFWLQRAEQVLAQAE